MSRRTFIINFKNYAEVLGDGSLRLAMAASAVAADTGSEIVVAPPVPSLAWVASAVKLPVFSQKVEEADQGRSTGSIIPEALKGWGCAGSIVNHSEARLSLSEVAKVVPRMKKLKLLTCVCAESAAEVAEIAKLAPEMIAIEPKDLIGTGIAVSKARPGLIADTVAAARDAGYRGRVLCGAGIVSAEDVSAALRLGAEGILVSSAVVKAKDWEPKILELASALTA